MIEASQVAGNAKDRAGALRLRARAAASGVARHRAIAEYYPPASAGGAASLPI